MHCIIQEDRSLDHTLGIGRGEVLRFNLFKNGELLTRVASHTWNGSGTLSGSGFGDGHSTEDGNEIFIGLNH